MVRLRSLQASFWVFTYFFVYIVVVVGYFGVGMGSTSLLCSFEESSIGPGVAESYAAVNKVKRS